MMGHKERKGKGKEGVIVMHACFDVVRHRPHHRELWNMGTYLSRYAGRYISTHEKERKRKEKRVVGSLVLAPCPTFSFTPG